MNEQADDFGEEFEKLRALNEMKLGMFADQVRKLSELRDEGLLTEEEFTAKKSELLGRL